MDAINECSKLVARSLELLNNYVDMGADISLNKNDFENAIKLLEKALDKLVDNM